MKFLTPEERSFFSLVSGAVLANPFSDDRTAIDLRISGLFPDASDEMRLGRTISEVSRRIETLETGGRGRIDLFSGEDRRLLTHAFLFDVFHRFLNPLDQFIIRQVRQDRGSGKVPFAGEALALLHRRGFTPEDACRYFALCFQLRRAFFFIHRNLVGRSPCMKELRRKLWNTVFTHDIDLYSRLLLDRMEDFSTLLLGETGTGKGAAAAAIGRSGFIPFDPETGRFIESFPDIFISLNLSQYSEALIESELFGHKKGAFTGAVEDHRGVLDQCSDHGAIFLDEIGEVSQPIQIKLLQVLQERIFSPVGRHETRRFKGRVIAATNRTLRELRTGGLLRDDFYYRLCSDLILVPPLRQRIREDSGELDDLLAVVVTRLLGAPSPEVTDRVKTGILTGLGLDYPWPGNVRELEQYARRVLLNPTCRGDTAHSGPDSASRFREDLLTGEWDAAALLSEYCRLLYERLGSYEAVARRTLLDRRTVKKYIKSRKNPPPGNPDCDP